MSEPTASTSSAGPRWRPLDRTERRVVGVLAEKAKTTPDNYPMSINGLVTGSNQKSNRFPQMTVDEAQVQEALDSLRKSGAVALIQGDGRVEKYRHLLYDWLGVDKGELAVMTELLLRGAQTLGELRGRAARMEPIKDIGELMPIVDRLRQKNLLIYLSAPGRGGVVTHNLYQPQELAKLRSEHGDSDQAIPAAFATHGTSNSAKSYTAAATAESDDPRTAVYASPLDGEIQRLREEIAALKQEIANVKKHVGL